MQEELDYSTLSWVKHEISESLKQIRHALELYAEDSSDQAQIRFCVTYLHQIYGTLHMVEIHGAALLTEEMELLASAMAQDEVKNLEAGFDVLMRGLIQLPHYLEGLERGQPDIPAVLIPLLNDLRAAREAPLMSESAFFSPDLSVNPPLALTSNKPIEDMAAFTKRLRWLYQSSLLAWFNDKANHSHFEKLGKVIGKLEKASSTAEARKFWWIANGLVEALCDEGLEPGISVISLLGRIDKEIKRLKDKGEADFSLHPPQELIKNCLYYVARASSKGPRVSELNKAFKLGELVLKDTLMDQASDELKGSNAEIMHNVYLILKDDLTAVKDRLDVFVRAQERNLDELLPLAESLYRTADTLAMLGMMDLRKICQDQAGILHALIAEKKVDDDEAFMNVASALLYVESTLDNQEISPQTRRRKESDSPDMSGMHPYESSQVLIPALEQEQINLQVIGNARNVLSEVKETFNRFEDDNSNLNDISQCPDKLLQVRGALSIMGLERAATLVSSTILFIRNEVLGTGGTPDAAQLDTLADAITSIDYFLEAIEDGRGPSKAVLKIAEISVDQLGYPADQANALLNEKLKEKTAADKAQQAAAGTEASPSAGSRKVRPLGTAAASTDEEDKAEILEIFLEEAAEVSVIINTALDKWRIKPDDLESLGDLRRCYHTLKGSGRLAGALQTGEFAWAVENMLNRVLEGKLAQSNDMLSLLDHAQAMLQKLLTNLQGETDTPPDTAPLVTQLERMAKGEKVDLATLSVAQTPAPPASQAEIPDITSEVLAEAFTDSAYFPDEEADDDQPSQTSQADPVLLEIFRKETESHLASLQTYLDNLPPADSALVTDPVYRALHTLHGSARMANNDLITRLCQPMDYLARTLYQNKLPFGVEGISALRQFVDAVQDLVHRGGNGEDGPDYAELADTIEGLRTAAMTMASQFTPMLSSSFIPAPPFSTEQTEDETDAMDFVESSVRQTSDVSDNVTLNTEDDQVDEQPEPSQFTKRDRELPPETSEPSAITDTAVADAVDEDIADNDTQDDAEITPAREEMALEFDAFDDQPEDTIGSDSVISDYENELLAVFLEEAEEIQEKTEQTLQAWSQDLDNIKLVGELQRALHTFKGSARMANVSAIGDLAHAIESLLEGITERRLGAQASHPDLLQRCHDWFTQALETVKQGQPVDAAKDLELALSQAINPDAAAEAEQEVDDAAAEFALGTAAPVEKTPKLAAVTEMGKAKPVEGHSDDLNEIIEFIEAFSFDAQEAKQDTAAAAPGSFEQVRVRAELLNNLVNFSGEINIHNSRISQQLSAFQFNLTEMEQTVNRLREQLRNFEILTETQMMYRHEPTSSALEDFDPLEMDRFSSIQHLSRAMVESLGDLTSIQNLLSNLASDSFGILSQQEKVTGELQEGLMRTRMVAFASIMPRLRRIVRQTATETRKLAALSITGGEGEMDRSQLTRLIPILEHLLRNAVDHGVEAPEQRKANNKSVDGKINIDFSQRGSEVIIKISDDGNGINIDAIRRKAIQKGLMNENARLADSEVIQFIFESGFSTAEKVTQISGRGVGMDVVNTEIKQLGGVIHVESEAGKGTRFIISLPLTLLANQALMVEAGESIYAIQLTNLEHVVRVNPRELKAIIDSDSPVFHYGEQPYHFLSLAKVLQGIDAAPVPEGERIPLLLLRSADQYVAVQVDSLLGREEIVIKSVGPQLSSVSVLSGATILPDGRIALILDIANLIRSFLAQKNDTATPLLPTMLRGKAGEQAPTVLIVDDSITVRKVTARLLGRYNYQTLTAKDGIDAIDEMEKQVPDVVLLDVEMPRMDGFELASHMRNDDKLRDVPIIMITSRTGDKHRQHALDIGVTKYMGKPYQEKELLDSIAELTHTGTEG